MSSKRGNKQPKSSLTLGDTRAFYKLLFGRLDESGMIDLNTTLLEFKRLYSPAQGVTGLLREEYEKRRREHPSVSEFRQWAIFHDYHTENVEHDSDTEEDGTNKDQNTDHADELASRKIFHDRTFYFLNSQLNDVTVELARACYRLLKSEVKEAHDAYVIGFGEFNSKMDKFLHTHQHDIYLPTFIFASVESESLCYFDEHVLITRSNWIRGGGMPYLDTMLDPVTGGRIPAGAQRTELIGSKSTQTEIVEPTPIPKTTSMETTMDSNIGVAEIAVNTSSDDPLENRSHADFRVSTPLLEIKDNSTQTEVTGVLEAAADNQVGLNDLRNGAYETWLATNLPVEMSRNDGFKTASVAAFHVGFDLVFNVKNYCILKWCEAVKEQQITIVNESITDNVLTTLMQYNRIKAYTTTDRKARLRRFLESKEALDILVDFLTYFGPLYPFKETFQIMFKHADEKHSD